MVALVDRKKEPSPRTDAELMAEIATGKLDALGVLFDRHATAVHQLVSRVGRADEADDVVQETFLRVARVAERYESRRENARAWIVGIAHSIVREKRRAGARFVRALASFAGFESHRAHMPVGASRTEIERALAALSNDKRDVLVLVEMLGMSGPEAAEVVGVPVGTVWTRLHHARRALSEHLGGDHE